MFARRTLFIALVLIIVFALVGCGQPAAQTDAPASTAEPTAPTAAAKPAAGKPAASTPAAAPAGATATAGEKAAPTVPPAEQATPAAGAATEAPAGLPGAAASAEKAGADSDPEPNTPDAALPIEAGETSGALIEDDEDWFAFQAPASAVMTVSFATGSDAMGMQVALKDADGYDVWHEYNVKAPQTKSFNLVHAGAEGAEYTMGVFGGTGAYSLEVVFESQDDAGIGADAGDDISVATPITAGTVITGMIGDLDRDDYYLVDVKPSAIISLTFSSADGANKQGVLLDPDGYELWHEYNIKTRAKSFQLILSADDAGEYYVRATGEKGPYQFALDIASQDDAGSGKDAGDASSSAIPIELGESYTGLVGDHDDYDMYEFEAEGGDILNVSLSTDKSAEDTQVVVLDRDEYELWHEYDLASGRSASFSHTLDAEAGGTYYIAVIGGRAAYTLSLEAGAQNDAGSGGDAGDTTGKALEIDADGEYRGQIGGADYEDVYAFEVPGGSVLAVSVTTDDDAESIDFALWEPEEYELWREYEVDAGRTKAFTYVVGSQVGGTYYLWVGAPGGEDDHYSFTIEVVSQDDAGSGGDAGDTAGTAIEIASDEEYTGLVGDEDSHDYYRFEPEVGQVVVVTGAEGAEDLMAHVLDGEEYELWNVSSIVTGDTAEFEITELEGETPYYVWIYGGTGSYTVEVQSAE